QIDALGGRRNHRGLRTWPQEFGRMIRKRQNANAIPRFPHATSSFSNLKMPAMHPIEKTDSQY
ncbi:MAG: hypothetical protein WCA52_12225, partial [Candidatus Aquilonibacter sp.]